MDWFILALFLSVLGISVILIIVTLISLPQLGDERKNLIKMKAQSYTFVGVIGYALIEMVKKIYVTWKNGSSEGINPFTFLVTISSVYLISLLLFKKKYGG